MSAAVVMDITVNSPIEKVWSALTDSATLSKWMLFKVNDFQPVVGHTFQFSGAPGWDGAVDCEVLTVEQPHRLAYSWTTAGQDDVPHATVVTWTLTEGDGGTQLHFEQTGFRPDAQQEIGGATYSWTHMLNELQQHLAA